MRSARCPPESQGFDERLHRAVESSGLQPVIDKVFSFEDAPAAYAHLEKGAHMGKVVIRLSD